MNKSRCNWVEGKEEIYIDYHDNQWGKPVYDDKKLYEMLMLESFQAGLSWITILKKRKNFKEAFDDFDYKKIAEYNQKKIDELLENEGIIRHKGKINSAIVNAQVFIKIQEEHGSFSNYIWSFTDNEVLKDSDENYQTKSPLSEKISKDLKNRGMNFVGPTIIYSYLESIGIINNHQHNCFKY